MEVKNCVYNHNFLHPPNSIGRWPLGWERAGGDEESSWQRVTEYAEDGRYCLLVENPTSEDFCGVRERPPEPIRVTPGETWRATVAMRAEKPGLGRIKIDFRDAAGEQVDHRVRDYPLSREMVEYTLDYLIPARAVQAVLEAGVVGRNRLWIDRVSKTRLETPAGPVPGEELAPLLAKY